MFIFDNFYYERHIMIDNRYYCYYYVCFKLCLQYIFLSDYYNVMLVTIKKLQKFILELYFTLK